MNCLKNKTNNKLKKVSINKKTKTLKNKIDNNNKMLMSFDEYMTKMKYSGVIIHDKIKRKNADIDNVLREIGNYWKEHPNLRFGEMLTNVVESNLEWLEDDEILKLFQKN